MGKRIRDKINKKLREEKRKKIRRKINILTILTLQFQRVNYSKNLDYGKFKF